MSQKKKQQKLPKVTKKYQAIPKAPTYTKNDKNYQKDTNNYNVL